MTMSKCGRYWYDLWHEPVDGWRVAFIPARRGDITVINRGGFVRREQAELALMLLVEEWCVTTEVDCGGGA